MECIIQPLRIHVQTFKLLEFELKVQKSVLGVGSQHHTDVYKLYGNYTSETMII